METTTIIIAGIIALLTLGALGFFLIWKKQKKKGSCVEKEPNYLVFFIIGISWFPIGIATNNHTFTLMGAIFLIYGLMNKDKWKKEKKCEPKL